MLTLIEAAERLGVRPATLRQQIANGKLRARKVGRDWTVTAREVERYRRDSQDTWYTSVTCPVAGCVYTATHRHPARDR